MKSFITLGQIAFEHDSKQSKWSNLIFVHIVCKYRLSKCIHRYCCCEKPTMVDVETYHTGDQLGWVDRMFL